VTAGGRRRAAAFLAALASTLLAQSEGNVTTNLNRIYEALGGGWTAAQTFPPASPRPGC
jgi:hypothetical protein